MATAPATASLLVLQTELAAHLRAALADVRPAVHVLTPGDLAGEEAEGAKTTTPTAAAQPVPAVNVVYMGHRFSAREDQQRTDGRALVMQQLLAAEVVTRNVRSLKAGSAARADGGELALRVLQALMGTRLASAAGPLRLVSGPGPVYRSGMQYLTLLAQADVVIRKT
jgi:hypothetical protein